MDLETMTRSKAEQILKEIEEIAERRYLPIIGPRRGRILAKVVRETKPKRVLEIGTLVGYSTILIGMEMDSDACIVTVESHADEAGRAKVYVTRAEIPPTVEVVVDDAAEVLPRLDGTFDLVFIDASKREYLDYIRLIEDKLHKGSVIVADNAGIYTKQMRDYLNYVRRSGKYRSECIQADGDALEVSVKL